MSTVGYGRIRIGRLWIQILVQIRQLKYTPPPKKKETKVGLKMHRLLECLLNYMYIFVFFGRYSDDDDVSHNSRLDEQAGLVGALLKLHQQHASTSTSVSKTSGLSIRALP
jgi:hypothetical protein